MEAGSAGWCLLPTVVSLLFSFFSSLQHLTSHLHPHPILPHPTQPNPIPAALDDELKRITEEAEAERLRLTLAINIEQARQKKAWKIKLAKRRRKSQASILAAPSPLQGKGGGGRVTLPPLQGGKGSALRLLNEAEDLRNRLRREEEKKKEQEEAVAASSAASAATKAAGQAEGKEGDDGSSASSSSFSTSTTTAASSTPRRADPMKLNLSSLRYLGARFGATQLERDVEVVGRGAGPVDLSGDD